MANNTYTGAAAGAWETGGNWSAGHKPTSLESAIINANNPTAPLADETVHDLTYSVAATLDASAHLTVSTNVTQDGGGTLKIKTQTGSGGVVAVSAGTLIVTGAVAGTVTVTSTGHIGAGSYNGAVTLWSGIAFDTGFNVVNGSLTVPGDGLGGLQILDWGASSSVHFTGTGLGILSSGGLFSGPATVVADGDLLISPSSGDNLDLDNATITCAGSCIITPDPSGTGNNVSLIGATITGPSLADAFYKPYGITGSPTVTGYGPAYKVGSGSTQVGTYLGTVTIPTVGQVATGIHFGPGDGLTGTGGPGHGGMGLGI